MTGTMRANQRLGVFFDADNAEILGPGNRVHLDLPAIIEIVNHRELIRAIYYKPERFFSEAARRHVERLGFEAKATFKNSDSWFIVDAIALAHRCDVIVFIGVDRDLEPVIPMLKSLGVRVEGMGWKGKVSDKIIGLLDSFIPLTADLILDGPGNKAA